MSCAYVHTSEKKKKEVCKQTMENQYYNPPALDRKAISVLNLCVFICGRDWDFSY